MKKLLFNSILLGYIFLFSYCSGSKEANINSIIEPNDTIENNIKPKSDTLKNSTDTIVNKNDNLNVGDSKIPGSKPKPSSNNVSKIDSIKNSYPKKK